MDDTARRDSLLVGLLLGLCAVLLAGWFATGHASAPDDGLLQIDVLSLHERVPGVEPVDGLPTMVVLAGRCPVARSANLGPAYGVVVHRPGDPGYADLTRRLALPQALDRCVPGYVLVDADGFVRYRSYDPGWHAHAQEQQILLDALAGHG